MTESDNLESWLAANDLSELLSILLENEVSELSDLIEFLEDDSAVDEFIQELEISDTLKSKFKKALLTLSNSNDTSSLQNEETDKNDKPLADVAPKHNNLSETETKLETYDDSDDDCYQEAFID
eukprot:163403_1